MRVRLVRPGALASPEEEGLRCPLTILLSGPLLENRRPRVVGPDGGPGRRTAPARAALEQKFLDEADGDPVRAEHLRKAHFARLALKSAQARRKIAALTAAAEAAETELQASGDPAA